MSPLPGWQVPGQTGLQSLPLLLTWLVDEGPSNSDGLRQSSDPVAHAEPDPLAYIAPNRQPYATTDAATHPQPDAEPDSEPNAAPYPQPDATTDAASHPKPHSCPDPGVHSRHVPHPRRQQQVYYVQCGQVQQPVQRSPMYHLRERQIRCRRKSPMHQLP